MQQLELRRLSVAESEDERSRVTELDQVSDRSFPFPNLISAKNLRSRLGVSKATLWRYRRLALLHCGEYMEASLRNNPGYLIGASDIPDKPPFTKRQAEILQDISLLFDSCNNQKIVVSFLDQFSNNG